MKKCNHRNCNKILDANGYFCAKKFTNRQIVLSTLQINTATSNIINHQNGGVVFKI